MNIIKLKVQNFEITPLEKQYVVENQVNEFAIDFEFDDTWNFETKYVIFDNEESTYKRPIIDNRIIIPSELLNGRTTIQIYGQNVENGEIVKRKPSYKYSFSILNSLSTEGQEESDLPTPSQWEVYISQIEEMCNDLQDQFDDLKEECETKCDDVIERLEKDEQDIQTNTDNIRANAEAIDKLNTDLLDYSLITETGNKISMSINPNTYVITLSLKDKNDNVLSTQSIDLPLETMIVSASYSDGILTFTLKNGQTLQVPIGDLISGLVSTTTFDETVQGLSNRISTIENDYLKSADKTELQEQITANADDIDDIQEEQLSQNADIEALQNENERLSRIVEGLPTKQASGTNFLLTDMVKANVKEYELKGDTSQDGTPTPSDPIPVEVVTGNQEINVFGKNYFDKSNPDVKNIYIDSTNSKIGNLANARSIIVPCRPNTNYTVSKIVTPRFIVGLTDVIPENNVTCLSIMRDDTATQLTIAGNASAKYLIVFLTNSYDSSTWQNILDSIQIEEGSTKTSYEQYSGYTKPISLGNIELCKIGDYQDRIYKQGNKWYLEKNIGKVVLNGSENFTVYASTDKYIGFTSDDVINSIDYSLCYSNLFSYANDYSSLDSVIGKIAIRTGGKKLYFSISQTNATEFKQWLSTHNTSVYYISATPVITEITDTFLITQLESVLDIILNTNNTIITNGELPTIIDITGYVDIMSLITTQDSRSVPEETRKGGEPIEEPIETKEEER